MSSPSPDEDSPTDVERAYGAGFVNEPHPALTAIPAWSGIVRAGWETDFLGVQTRVKYFSRFDADYSTDREVHPTPPVQNEDYFEWIDLLESVLTAADCFRMIELGAGWGKWIAAGAVAARRAGVDAFVIGVEAEPTHFEWMREHLVDNSVDLKKTRLVNAAVAATPGTVRFHVGDPAGWYGQKIETGDIAEREGGPTWLARLRKRRPPEERRVEEVPAVTLASLLSENEVVDLIDSDIQGSEAEVFEAAGDRLSEVVRRVHIGTHSDENEERLRTLFRGLGWECRNDFPNGRRNETPYGPMPFEDGVQTWINPRLNRARN